MGGESEWGGGKQREGLVVPGKGVGEGDLSGGVGRQGWEGGVRRDGRKGNPDRNDIEGDG